ncbi:hypothetical protein [Flavivirga jejuensis]|uniref:Lipocalin-like domain-containing protein n=1 Tax=Flavivirga jejuensis TaxID=870487 RepID=A0ABT8WP72_9FLAO|nr:hypothetical protein [Flavivirga jejuensis]MDO5974953.1 hypothetical protein [Flavivirga jejuensis]
MKIILRILFFGIIFPFLSFNNEPTDNLTDKLIGSWKYNKTMKLYVKVNSLAPKETGYEFKANGKVAIKRFYVNKCGNSKIYNKNYDTTWQTTSDSTLVIKYHYKDKITKKHLLIKKLTTNFLAFKYIPLNASSLNDNGH